MAVKCEEAERGRGRVAYGWGMGVGTAFVSLEITLRQEPLTQPSTLSAPHVNLSTAPSEKHPRGSKCPKNFLSEVHGGESKHTC